MCKKIDCIGLIADTPVTSYLSLTPSSSGSDGVTFLVTHGRTRRDFLVRSLDVEGLLNEGR